MVKMVLLHMLVKNGNWYIGNHDTNFPAQGQKGENGKDGASPYIGP